MGKKKPIYGIIDVNKSQIIAVEDKAFRGGCHRCGKCCAREHTTKVPCDWLRYETLDGKKIAYCFFGGERAGQYNKPLSCRLYPLPWEKKPESCGIWWEEM